MNDPKRLRSVAPAVALGSSGTVHVLYYDLQDDAVDYQGLEGPTWEGTWSLVASTSGDGGRTFSRGVVVDEDLVPPERVMLIYTMPPPALVADGDGRVFASWYDARNGDWDVFFRRSLDKGETWQKPQRLNDDAMGNRRHQYLPRLSVSPNGRVDAIFYDRRSDPQNVRNDVYYTFSGDHGSNFARNVKLTSDSSDSRIGQAYLVPSAQGLIEFGSRLGAVSQKSTLLAAWTDTRNFQRGSQQDIFSVQVTVPAASQTEARRWLVGAFLAVSLASAGLLLRRRHRSKKGHAPSELSAQGADS